MQPLLTIQDLSAGYGGKTVIRDISLTLMPGEILGVVGESGSGKTTLLKAVSEVKGSGPMSIREQSLSMGRTCSIWTRRKKENAREKR